MYVYGQSNVEAFFEWLDNVKEDYCDVIQEEKMRNDCGTFTMKKKKNSRTLTIAVHHQQNNTIAEAA